MKIAQPKIISEKQASVFTAEQHDNAITGYGYNARTNYPLRDTQSGSRGNSNTIGGDQKGVLQMKAKSAFVPGAQHQQGCNCANCMGPVLPVQRKEQDAGDNGRTPGFYNSFNTANMPVIQRAKNNKGEDDKKKDDKKKKGTGKGIQKPKHKKASKAALSRSIKKEQKTAGWDFATGHTSSGKWPEDVTVRGAHTFDAERVRQVLRHLATIVFHFVKATITKEQEVQAMYVADRLLLSSNDPASMALFSKIDTREVFDIFLSGKYLPKDDERALGDLNKLRALIAGSRIEDLAADPVEALALKQVAGMIRGAISDPSTFLPVIDLETASTAITDDGYRNKVILVKGMEGAHAEQNLILAYRQSGSKEKGLVYGKKRPCTGCYMTFAFAVKALGCNLVHSDKAGGFWGPAEKGLWALMQEKPGLTIDAVDEFVCNHLPEETHRTAKEGRKKSGDKKKSRHDGKNEETGYDSGSDSEGEEFDLPFTKYKKRFIDKSL